MTSPFGYRADPFTGERRFHGGLDLGVPQGTPIYPVTSGIVTAIGDHDRGGWFVMVDHGNGWTSSYSHLSQILVSEGQGVGRNAPIALSGGTPGHPGAGRSTGPHLHYAIKHRGQPVDPLPITAWNGWQLTRG